MFIGTLAFVRLLALFRRIKWRNDLSDDEFPSKCGSWAEDNGCTRLTLASDGCVRASSLKNSNSVIFDTNVDRLLNTQISQCVSGTKGAKLMSPKDLDKSTHNGILIHVTFNSAIFGFIDDLYMMTSIYIDGENLMRSLKIQSQLRMGSYDFD